MSMVFQHVPPPSVAYLLAGRRGEGEGGGGMPGTREPEKQTQEEKWTTRWLSSSGGRRGRRRRRKRKRRKDKERRNAIDVRKLLAVAILATTPTRTDSLSSFSHFNLIKLEWQPFLKIAYLRDHNRYQMPIRAATTRRLYLAPPGIIGQRIRHLTNNRHQSALTRLE